MPDDEDKTWDGTKFNKLDSLWFNKLRFMNMHRLLQTLEYLLYIN